MSKIALTPNASGSGTFTIAAPNSNTDRTLTLPDEAGTVLTSASTINPTFVGALVYFSSNPNISNDTNTKILLDTEVYDEGGYFDTTNNRFVPPNGFYLVNVVANWNSNMADGTSVQWLLYKNGSEYQRNRLQSTGTGDTGNSAHFVFPQTTATDYWEIYVWQNSGSTETLEAVSGKRSFVAFSRLGV